ncbi:hypothetical protein D3C72_2401360 [compost metagenome]
MEELRRRRHLEALAIGGIGRIGVIEFVDGANPLEELGVLLLLRAETRQARIAGVTRRIDRVVRKTNTGIDGQLAV